jgi:hypothetical protein
MMCGVFCRYRLFFRLGFQKRSPVSSLKFSGAVSAVSKTFHKPISFGGLPIPEQFWDLVPAISPVTNLDLSRRP